jgi:hypothetical protein
MNFEEDFYAMTNISYIYSDVIERQLLLPKEPSDDLVELFLDPRTRIGERVV